MNVPRSPAEKRSVVTVQRFLPAMLLVLVVTGTAPVIDRIRAFAFDTFPRATVPALGIGFVALAAALFLFALLRIRQHRWLRYGGLIIVGALLWLQAVGFSRGIPRVDVVEKIHILEYGLLAYLLYRAWRPTNLLALVLPLLGVACAGLIDEWVQWWAPQRVGEMRDVVLNIFAGLCGLLFALCLDPPPNLTLRTTRHDASRVLRAAALALLIGGLFFSLAHLGYEIEDEEIGQFRSWFRADALRRLAVERAQTWAHKPPTGREVWSREDYYLTEAGWHANHRNDALRRGNALLAWKANRILEVYYTPFLEVEGFHGSGKHRLTAAKRAALAVAVQDLQADRYTSPVLVDRITTWPPKKAFLAVVLIAATLLWFAPRLLGRSPRST